jgi:phosphatidylglycerol:prolipoprotein diacylglycerol transferase
MFPTLFTIGRLSIPTYTVLLDLGLILGLLLTYLEGKRRLGDGPLALDLGLWTVVGGIVSGRLGYVVANWAVFSEDWVRILRIWEGGLSWHGAFLGGILVMVVFAQLQRRAERPVSFWELADVVTLGLALGISFGWAACLAGGCAYGALGEGMGYALLPDLYGVDASRFATQAVGLAVSLILFAGFWLLRGLWPFPGASFLMYLLLYFAGQVFLEFSRGDEAIYLGPWRLAQVFDLAVALTAALVLLVRWWQWRTGDGPADSIESISRQEAADQVEQAEIPAGEHLVEEPDMPAAEPESRRTGGGEGEPAAPS